MGLYRSLMRPLIFRLDPERCHNAAIWTCRMTGAVGPLRGLVAARYSFRDPRLAVSLGNLHFANPIGLAAGFDKSGRAVQMLGAIGFGHVEIGSISADPSLGNPKPRLFRLPADRAVIVHYGLPNDGAAVVAERLARQHLSVPLGINIVKTNRGIHAPAETDDAVIDDYLRSVRILKGSGDYLSLNLSCPNTENGRNFFAEPGNTRRLLLAIANLGIPCPVFLKVSPLGGAAAIETLLESVDGIACISGFAFNLAPGRPETLKTPREVWQSYPGAIAGKPVETQMNDAIRELYRRMDRKRYRIIGIGGVFTAEDAYRKIRLGASLVQLYTALVYEGPGVVTKINRDLCALLKRDGFTSVADAVGLDAGV
jgi:dihydroorotate dehydrogenase (fumarate)/dihydroorotate dehydrogenase